MNEQAYVKYGVIGIAVVGFLALVIVAFAGGGDLEGRTWVVSEMTVDGAAVSPVDGSVISAEFDNGNMGGIAGCNNYFASYRVDGDAIEFGPAGSTMMYCEEPQGIMDQEHAYLALLGSVDRFSLDGDVLTLRSGSDVVITYHEAVPMAHGG